MFQVIKVAKHLFSTFELNEVNPVMFGVDKDPNWTHESIFVNGCGEVCHVYSFRICVGGLGLVYCFRISMRRFRTNRKVEKYLRLQAWTISPICNASCPSLSLACHVSSLPLSLCAFPLVEKLVELIVVQWSGQILKKKLVIISRTRNLYRFMHHVHNLCCFVFFFVIWMLSSMFYTCTW